MHASKQPLVQALPGKRTQQQNQQPSNRDVPADARFALTRVCLTKSLGFCIGHVHDATVASAGSAVVAKRQTSKLQSNGSFHDLS